MSIQSRLMKANWRPTNVSSICIYFLLLCSKYFLLSFDPKTFCFPFPSVPNMTLISPITHLIQNPSVTLFVSDHCLSFFSPVHHFVLDLSFLPTRSWFLLSLICSQIPLSLITLSRSFFVNSWSKSNSTSHVIPNSPSIIWSQIPPS